MCVFAIFGSPAFYTRTLLFNRFIYRFDIDFKSPRIILSSIGLFVLSFAISFIIRAFSLSARLFPRPILLDEL